MTRAHCGGEYNGNQPAAAETGRTVRRSVNNSFSDIYCGGGVIVSYRPRFFTLSTCRHTRPIYVEFRMSLQCRQKVLQVACSEVKN